MIEVNKNKEINEKGEVVLSREDINRGTSVTICAVPLQYSVRVNNDLVWSCNHARNAAFLSDLIAADIRGTEWLPSPTL